MSVLVIHYLNVRNEYLLPWLNDLCGIDDHLVVVERVLDDRVGHAAVVDVALQVEEPGALVVQELADILFHFVVDLVDQLVDGFLFLSQNPKALKLLHVLAEGGGGDALAVSKREKKNRDFVRVIMCLLILTVR